MEATPPPGGFETPDHDRPGREAGWRAGTGDGTDPDRHVHVVVLGLPGVGTSKVGRLLARHLQRPYVDHDAVVGLSCDGDVQDGASRHDDDDVLRRVLGTHHSVVYGVGGQILEQIGPHDLDDAYVVWLDADPEVIVARLATTDHPVLGSEPLSALREMAARLEPLVRDVADLRISVDQADPGTAAEQIRQAWRRHVDEIESAS